MGIKIALRAFFTVLFNRNLADKIKVLLDSSCDNLHSAEQLSDPVNSGDSKAVLDTPISDPKSKGIFRSEALELLAALQRDARFLDFVKEDIGNCDDATLAAAARITHDRCAETLERFFKIRPLSETPEGETTTIDLANRNPTRTRVSGSSFDSAARKTKCRVAHAGWIAEKCEPPCWSGRREDALVLAPVELEIENF